jgi:hypothetical protein
MDYSNYDDNANANYANTNANYDTKPVYKSRKKSFTKSIMELKKLDKNLSELLSKAKNAKKGVINKLTRKRTSKNSKNSKNLDRFKLFNMKMN